MRAEIIRIGNSKGLRIPKLILDQCGFRKSVNLDIVDHSLVVTSCSDLRAGWSEAFQQMACNQDDSFLDDDSASLSSDDEEWQW